MRLTEDSVRKLQPQAATYEKRLTETGLFVRVHPNGRKTFMLRRGHNGRDVRVTLGEFATAATKPGARTMTVAEAKNEVGASGKRLQTEGNFAAAEREERQQAAYTLADLAKDWETDAARRLRPNTLALHTGRLKNHILPVLGARPIVLITQRDVGDLALAITAKGKAITANRCVTLLGVLFRFARRRGHKVDVPSEGYQRNPERSRERILTDDELRTFWSALDDPEQPPGPQVALALKIALYSCMRAEEIVGARIGEIDETEMIWTVPADRTKGKLEKRHANHVPLTPRLLELLRQAPGWGAASPEAPLFPLNASKRRKRRNKAELPPLDPNASMPRGALRKAMERICKAKSIPHASAHDLRRTGRSLMSRGHLKIPRDIRERVLSHVVGNAVERAYDRHDYQDERREALQKLGEEIDRIVAGSNVIPMRARA